MSHLSQSERIPAPRNTSVGRNRLTLILILMSFSFWFLNFSGEMYLVEAALAAGLLMTLPRAHLRPKLTWTIAASLLAWGFGSLLSDMAASTGQLDLLKGLLRVVFLAVDIWALYCLCDLDLRAVRMMWLGIAISLGLSFFLQPSAYARGEPWKFGFAMPVTVIVLLWLVRRDRSKWISAGVMLSLASIHFILGYRSLSIVTLIAATLIMVRSQSNRVHPGQKFLVRVRPAALAVVGIGVLVGMSTVYDRLAESGSLGYAAQQKAHYQADGQFGSILSSRSEFLLSIQSIGANPILGGGTGSVANLHDTAVAATIMNDFGYSNVARALGESVPAYHSELLGVWAQNGILAVPFWVLLFGLLVAASYAVVYRETRLPELVAFLAALGIWDLFFSPFGADRRMWVAATLVTIVISSTRNRKRAHGQDFHRDNKL